MADSLGAWESFLEALGLDDFDQPEPSDEIKEQIRKEEESDHSNQEMLRRILAVDFGDDEVQARIQDLAEGDTGALRKELLELFLMILIRTSSEEEMLEHLKKVVPPDHYRCLLDARQVVRYEDAEREGEATILKEKMVRRYGETARRIYNWVRSGFVEGWLWQRLQVEKFFNPGGWEHKIRGLWVDHYEFFPKAIWVGSEMTGKEVHQEIDHRIMEEGVDEVRVYARGPNRVRMVRRFEDWFDEVHSNVTVETDESDLGDSPALTLFVRKIDSSEPVEHVGELAP